MSPLAEFQESAGRLNAPVVVIARYASGQPDSAAHEVAASSGQFDALFIPDQADDMPAVAASLASSEIKTQLLGTGVWNDARVLRLPQLQGAWFSAPDNAGFNAMAQRYRAKFNSDPARLATLSYDAVTLAAALARGDGRGSFQPAGLDQRLGVQRGRRRLPLPSRRDQRTRPRGDGDRQRRRHGDQPGATQLRRRVRRPGSVSV